MPCHWPMKTRLMRSFTTAEPSSPIRMASEKSAIRQLWAKSGTAVQKKAHRNSDSNVDRKAIAPGREAAQKCSPRRKPCVSSRRILSPEGAKESFRIDNSWRRSEGGANRSFAPVGLARPALTHGLRRGLHSCAASRLQTASTRLELHCHRLAVGCRHFEELALLEAEHSGENVRRE